MKPPHTDTIELTPEMIKRGQREHQFAEWVGQYKRGALSEDAFQVLLQWERFYSWYWKL